MCILVNRRGCMWSKLDYFRHRSCNATTTKCQFRGMRSVFIGDSITRELFDEAGYLFDAPKFVWKSLVSVPDLQSLTRGKCISANEQTRGTTIVWVGGNAIHFLLRSHNKRDPVGDYVNGISPILLFLKNNCTNSIFIGPTPVEASIFMSPPKHDWRHFDDFSLLDLWHKEAEVLAAHHNVRYFDTHEIGRQHAKCRCDGMHFGSAFPEWNCTSSLHLWRYEMCRQIVAGHWIDNFDPPRVRNRRGIE